MNNWLSFAFGVVVGVVAMATYIKIKKEEEEMKETFDIPYKIESPPERYIGYDGSNYNSSNTTKEIADREAPSEDDDEDGEECDLDDPDASDMFDIELISEERYFTEMTAISLYGGEPFSDELEEFDKVQLKYYSEDNVLLDENDDEIAPGLVKTVIGEEALLNFGLDSENPNTVYVRNHSLNVDYEVLKFEDRYYND